MNPNIARIMGGAGIVKVAPNFILWPSQRAASNQPSASDFAYFLGVSADGENFYRGKGPGLMDMPAPTWYDGATAITKWENYGGLGDAYVALLNNYGTTTTRGYTTLDGYNTYMAVSTPDTPDSNGGGSGRWISMANNGTIAIAIGASDKKVLYTGDLANWSLKTIPTKQWYNVVWDGTAFLITANTASQGCASSTDGITWSGHNIISGKPTYGQGLATNGSGICVQFVAANTSPYTVACGVTTDQGTNWSTVTLPGTTGAGNPRYQVAWDGTAFCAIGRTSAGSTCYVLTSPDGDPWTERTPPSPIGSIPWIFGTPGRFFCGSENGGQVYTSTDHGVTWTAINRAETRIAEYPWGAN